MTTDAAGFSVDDVRAALDRAHAAWDDVRAHGDVAARRLRLAGIDVEIAVAGDALATILLPSFDGLDLAAGPPRAVVGAWDASATGVPSPPRPADLRDGPFRCQVRRDRELVAEVQWSEDGVFRTGDRDAGLHLLGVPGVEVLTPTEAAAPLRRQLSWALSPEVVFVHAGAVGSVDGVALLLGRGGAGKSSTSLACLQAGMGFLADDYCLVRDEPPVAYRLHTTARLLDEDVRQFASLPAPIAGASIARETDTEEAKALYLLHELAPDRLLTSAPVRAVLVVDAQGDDEPRLVPLSGGQTLRLVAPHTLWQMSIEPDRELAALAKLFASVPCYRLMLSTDRGANPPLVQQALDYPRPR